MEQSSTISSNESSSSDPTSLQRQRSSVNPFAYQTRLLERTASLSRSNSISSRFPPPANASTPQATMRWKPNHRINNSVDSVRGKFEELSREAAGDMARSPTKPRTDTSSVNAAPPSTLSKRSSWAADYGTTRRSTNIEQSSESPLPNLPSNQSTRTESFTAQPYKTPNQLKRHTLPTPISLPISPNSTDSSQQAALSSLTPTPTPAQIHIPLSTNLESSSISSVKRLSNYVVPSPTPTVALRKTRSTNFNDPGDILETSPFPLPGAHSSSNTALSSRDSPVSRINDPAVGSGSSTLRRSNSLSRSARSPSFERLIGLNSSSAPSPVSAMSPTPYRSTYMASKKYNSSMVIGQRLGRHLPRIASGDGNDHDDVGSSSADDQQKQKEEDRRLFREEEERKYERLKGQRKWNFEHGGQDQQQHTYPVNRLQEGEQELIIPGITGADDVQGLRGRRKLSKSTTPNSPGLPSPLPSARLGTGLWADTQRHLLQAYEYLCHVGEAQQWIEGCLGEELSFGVVEMEEGLQNGVVLAKLVRALGGDARRIYEAPKLDFRHSDNINFFFAFVRQVGLPECFIFETTDLYNKKNLPKVIYCIHALSHLLARKGLTQRIGNLLGRLKFTDDQLQQTQKGLKDSGVSMPNFGNVGRELAKEIGDEPEVDEETEDERRDRLLLDCEDSIVAMQSLARGFMLRTIQINRRERLRLGQRHIMKLQAHCRALLVRRAMARLRMEQSRMLPWIIKFQALARSVVARRAWQRRLRRIHTTINVAIMIQAQARGVLLRKKIIRLRTALRRARTSFIKLQSHARAKVARRSHKEMTKTLHQAMVMKGVVFLQAALRGVIQRRKFFRQMDTLRQVTPYIIGMQVHSKAALIRRRVRNQLAKLDNITDVIVRIQAVSRAYLARKRLLNLIRGLRKATLAIISVQTLARASLTRKSHVELHKALSNVRVVSSIDGFQTFARAVLTRNRHREQQKQLDFVEPDIVGFQAVARGVLVRNDFLAWRDHLHKSHPAAIHLQSLFRGLMVRKKFSERMAYYRANLKKVVKIQSLFRAKETREQYRQLTMGTNVSVGTIKNFVHLLDDSEADFGEEIALEKLRKDIVESIRENQQLEIDLSELEVKIALVVQNVKSFEELLKARRRHLADSAAAHASRASVLAAHGDPFASTNTLDRTAKRKLELYQQLFYILQSKGEYLARLFFHVSRSGIPEKNKRLTERIVLTLFGYGQDRREEYLLLKLLQLSIREEIRAARSLDEVAQSHPMYMAVAVHYVRPKQVNYVKEMLQSVIREVVHQDDLDLETDPTAIYRTRINVEEMRSGRLSNKRKDVTYHEAVDDPDTRVEFIHHLQLLQALAKAFVSAIVSSTKKMPYGMQCIAREILLELRTKFPQAMESQYAACIGRVIFYRFINPAIVTPETFDIVPSTLSPSARKNLGEISKILTQISSGKLFGDDEPCLTPINSFVESSITQFSRWFLEVASASDAETQFHAHEFLDATVQPKPVYISPNEVYSMHTLLAQNVNSLILGHDDPLRVILTELDGVPNLGNEELNDARDRAIELQLSNRFALVKDPLADEKTLWIQCKRGVLAILRVQPAKDLLDSIFQQVEDEHELIWEDIVERELIAEHKRNRRMPSTTGADSAYRLEDIGSLAFRDVKANAIQYLLQLEKKGKITRADGYQGILDAIANDVRSKHRKRMERQNEIENMKEARKHLAERKKYFEEQIDSYHSYIESAMNTMQRGKKKKRFVLPFTKQYFHLRELQKSGKNPKFGSYKYSAQKLYEKGILLSLDQYSPRQFDRIDIVISSDEAGIFTLELYNNTLGSSTPVASSDIRIEDLLQAQFENRVSLPFFDGAAKFNLNLLLYQINVEFYI